MPIVVLEAPESRSLTGVDSFVWRYTIKGTLVIDEVANALFFSPLCPPNYGFWQRNWDKKTITPVDGGVWRAEVPYDTGPVPLVAFPSDVVGGGGGSPGPGGPGGVGGNRSGGYTLPGDEVVLGPEWSADFGGAAQSMRRSLAVVSDLRADLDGYDGVVPPPVEDLDLPPGGGPIRYDPKTDVTEGVDVPQPVQTRTLEMRVAGFKPKIWRRLERFQFHVNEEAFFGCAAGEVRFEGLRAQYRHADGVALTLTFAVRRNVTADNPQKVGPFFTITKCDGWDYIDPQYAMVKGTPGGPPLVLEPVRVRIHRVHPRADLNHLFT